MRGVQIPYTDGGNYVWGGFGLLSNFGSLILVLKYTYPCVNGSITSYTFSF
jgi:hypothetical protein